MKKVKTTKSGIKVTLDDKDVTVRYSKNCISMFSFKTKQKKAHKPPRILERICAVPSKISLN